MDQNNEYLKTHKCCNCPKTIGPQGALDIIFNYTNFSKLVRTLAECRPCLVLGWCPEEFFREVKLIGVPEGARTPTTPTNT